MTYVSFLCFTVSFNALSLKDEHIHDLFTRCLLRKTHKRSLTVKQNFSIAIPQGLCRNDKWVENADFALWMRPHKFKLVCCSFFYYVIWINACLVLQCFLRVYFYVLIGSIIFCTVRDSVLTLSIIEYLHLPIYQSFWIN